MIAELKQHSIVMSKQLIRNQISLLLKRQQQRFVLHKISVTAKRMSWLFRTNFTKIKSLFNFTKIKNVNKQFSTNISKYRYNTNGDYLDYKFFGPSAAALLLLFYELNERKQKFVQLQQPKNYGDFRSDLPEYTLDEITSHNNQQNRIWVTYKQGVYDITDFIPEHPGGDQILMAAGSSIEPFWALYGVHKQEPIYEILESMRIGNICEEATKHFTDGMDDPYANEPRRHQILKAASLKPFNAEPPSQLLADNFYTPSEIFYVRNHLPVPTVDPESYELEVEVEGTGKKVSYKLEQLKSLPKRTISATIMCAGNRRSEMSKVKPVKGLDWGIAAVGNSTFTGCSLRDILLSIGINEESKDFRHIHFEGLDTDTTGVPYGASIPISKALDARGDVILAYEMNDEPLKPDHGFPVRVVVPGVVGARNVKWLGKIIVAKEESTSHWQQNDYKGFSPSTDWDTVDFSKSPAIQELPVTSAICKPRDGETVEIVDGCVPLEGYAWSGGGRGIVRVDVTIDKGKTWHVASIDGRVGNAEPGREWSWILWSAKVPIGKECDQVEVWVKAVDSSYNTQPESFENIWNLRGVLGNAYHKINVKLKC